MAKDKTAQEDRAEEVFKRFEDPEALQQSISKSQQFIEKNNKIIIGGVVAIALAIVGYVWLSNMSAADEQKAQLELFPAVFYLENDSIDRAMNGDLNTTSGFKKIIEEQGGTNAATLAYYYQGIAYMKEAKYDEAIESFSQFSSTDLLVQARAYSLIGDAYMQKNDLANAIKYYKQAVEYKTNQEFSTVYLLKLGIAHQENNDIESAKAAYQRILDEFPRSSEVETAKKYLASF